MAKLEVTSLNPAPTKRLEMAEFTISIVFDDGTVRLGGGDDLYIESNETGGSVLLDDARLALIRRIQDAQNESV